MVYLLLVAQLCATTLPYASWFMSFEKELIELAETEDTETEKEDTKDEKDKKKRLQNKLSFLNRSLLNYSKNNLTICGIENIHHREITTPPPEYLFFIG